MPEIACLLKLITDVTQDRNKPMKEYGMILFFGVA
jgi:hypothetical protein